MSHKLTDEPGAVALAAQIRDGALTPLEAIDAAIARIEALDGPINAVIVRDFDRAREAARTLDGRSAGAHQPLFGVPMTIKESYDVAGLPTTWGLEKFAETIAQRDARVVTQLKDAGAILLGKTNVPPLLSDWQSSNAVYGRTNNPHDLSRSPGGSSGGSAAAVASGMVPCEIGSDIGGSIRVPAHFCGIWGHKPSWGLVDLTGHTHPSVQGKIAHDGHLGVGGPLARNAEDLALLLDLTALRTLSRRGKPLRECRILAVLDQEASPVDHAIRELLENALAVAARAGVAIDRQSDLLPDLSALHRDYMRMLGVAMARGVPGPGGKQATASDWFDLLDAQARAEAAWAQLFETYDFVLAPPAPILAFEHDDTAVRDRRITVNGTLRNFGEVFAWAGIATFPNFPSTVLPLPHDGPLPCGAQIIGPRWGDLDCIDAAAGLNELLTR